MDPDIEKIPDEMVGNEAIIICDLKKEFKGIGKEPVKAVQVIRNQQESIEDLLSLPIILMFILMSVSGCEPLHLPW